MGVHVTPLSLDQIDPVGPTATTVGRAAPGTHTPPQTPVRNAGLVRFTHVLPPSLVVAVWTSPGCAALPPPSAMPFRSSRNPIDCGPEPARVVSGSVSTDHVLP